jgi:hypothetical protein
MSRRHLLRIMMGSSSRETALLSILDARDDAQAQERWTQAHLSRHLPPLTEGPRCRPARRPPRAGVQTNTNRLKRRCGIMAPYSWPQRRKGSKAPRRARGVQRVLLRVFASLRPKYVTGIVKRRTKTAVATLAGLTPPGGWPGTSSAREKLSACRQLRPGPSP